MIRVQFVNGKPVFTTPKGEEIKGIFGYNIQMNENTELTGIIKIMLNADV